MTVPKRFGVLRFVGTLLKVVAWILLVLFILGAIAAVLFGGQLIDQLQTLGAVGALALPTNLSGIALGVSMLFLGIIYFLVLYVVGERLLLTVAVEENTRLTAALLLRLHQEGQTVGRVASYATSYPSEPFEG